MMAAKRDYYEVLGLAAALKELEGLIDDPMFTTRIGREVQFRSDSPSHGF
jgi:hypothetical protein